MSVEEMLGSIDGQISGITESATQIAHELEVLNMPPGYAGQMTVLRHRVAEQLFSYRVGMHIASRVGLTPDESELKQAAYDSWRAAEILADADPQSPDRLRGDAVLAALEARLGSASSGSQTPPLMPDAGSDF